MSLMNHNLPIILQTKKPYTIAELDGSKEVELFLNDPFSWFG